jgi:hypothetical protein
MSLVNHQLPALYNGISQQPPTLRLPSQGEVQINGWSTVVDGLRKRPPTQHVALLSNDGGTSALMHVINRDVDERYVVMLTSGNIEISDLAGNVQTVNFPYGTAYLDCDTPQSELAAYTVADYTFILNKTVGVNVLAVGADLTAQSDGNYWLNPNLPAAAVSGTPTTSAITMQYSPNPTGTLKGTVQSFDYLPWPGNSNNNHTPTEGDVYEIQGDDTSSFTAYYCIWQSGVWNETVAPGLQNCVDPTTMPWALVREADGTFTFSPFSWAPRRVGDETTNPNPSFVGRTINELFFYQNRLSFCDGENVVMSRAGDFGTFYRMTVLQDLDDDVIDIGASQTDVTDMNFALPFATGLMLFSDQTQFRLMWPMTGSLTPTTVALNVTTQYLCSTTVRPIIVGTDAYFVSEDTAYAKLREYFVTLDLAGRAATDATDITAHVPSYIPAGTYWLEGSLYYDTLFLVTAAYPNRVYVYSFYWTDQNDKAQSAWSYWDFGTGNVVRGVAALDDYVYFIVGRPDGTFIEAMSMAIGANVGLSDVNGNLYDLLIDRRTTTTGTYLSEGGYTIFNLPYSPNQEAFQLIQASDGATPGALNQSTITFTEANQCTIPGNVAGTYYCGEKYTFTYQFSEQFMPNQNNVAVLSGRLTLRNWTVYYNNTACFNVSVDPYGNGDPSVLTYIPSQSSAFDGLTLGESNIGAPVFTSGSFTFGVFGQSTEAIIQLTNDTPYQSTFTEAEWEADYTNRSRTV